MLPNIKNRIYSTDEFRMYAFKVKPCSRAYSHDWTECPFVHPSENAWCRDPRKFLYSCVPCPEFRKGSCRHGDACETRPAGTASARARPPGRCAPPPRRRRRRGRGWHAPADLELGRPRPPPRLRSTSTPVGHRVHRPRACRGPPELRGRAQLGGTVAAAELRRRPRRRRLIEGGAALGLGVGGV
uniref:AtC3H23-like CCCH zinc finger domain-containing protein n=1 Tax=Ananas comosus var. bracteatus TaxID=296719 RepID=A0A6V7NJF5_ANACO|nr:unnamed protein product [Ananas comosus var. bracteatus]